VLAGFMVFNRPALWYSIGRLYGIQSAGFMVFNRPACICLNGRLVDVSIYDLYGYLRCMQLTKSARRGHNG